jgi:hypothetical protein
MHQFSNKTSCILDFLCDLTCGAENLPPCWARLSLDRWQEDELCLPGEGSTQPSPNTIINQSGRWHWRERGSGCKAGRGVKGHSAHRTYHVPLHNIGRDIQSLARVTKIPPPLATSPRARPHGGRWPGQETYKNPYLGISNHIHPTINPQDREVVVTKRRGIHENLSQETRTERDRAKKQEQRGEEYLDWRKGVRHPVRPAGEGDVGGRLNPPREERVQVWPISRGRGRIVGKQNSLRWLCWLSVFTSLARRGRGWEAGGDRRGGRLKTTQ